MSLSVAAAAPLVPLLAPPDLTELAHHPWPRPLTRGRGGTYSPTVDTIRFVDGTEARTDLVRLNPNVNAYSLDFHGLSPRRLAHYREERWSTLRRQRSCEDAAFGLRAPEDAVLRILTHGFPYVSAPELTRRLTEAGYPVRGNRLSDHEAIAGTQAALWRVTNGLELDVRPLDVPVRASGRVGELPGRDWAAGPDGRVSWSTSLPAGSTAYLELELPRPAQLRSYEFAVGERSGRHPVTVRLQQSADGLSWRDVSGSEVSLAGSCPRDALRSRRLGHGATLHRAGGTGGERGHRHYRLAACGPIDRDGLLALRDIRLTVASSSRFVNSEPIAYLCQYLLGHALPQPIRASSESLPGLLGPFVSSAGAQIEAPGSTVVDASGRRVHGPLHGGHPFYLTPGPDGPVEVRVGRFAATARVLVGSDSPAGAPVFTPLVTLTRTPVQPSARYLVGE